MSGRTSPQYREGKSLAIFSKKIWNARTGIGLNKFKDILSGNTVQLESTPDSIQQQGTPLSATNLNDLELRIEDGVNNAASLFELTPFTGNDILAFCRLHGRNITFQAPYNASGFPEHTDYIPKQLDNDLVISKAARAVFMLLYVKVDTVEYGTLLCFNPWLSNTIINSETDTILVRSFSDAGWSGKWRDLRNADHANHLIPQQIPANTNLEDILQPGMYFCPSSTDVATIGGAPEGVAFSLLVEKHAGVKQTFTTYFTGNFNIYVRNYYSNIWGSWKKVNMTTIP